MSPEDRMALVQRAQDAGAELAEEMRRLNLTPHDLRPDVLTAKAVEAFAAGVSPTGATDMHLIREHALAMPDGHSDRIGAVVLELMARGYVWSGTGWGFDGVGDKCRARPRCGCEICTAQDLREEGAMRGVSLTDDQAQSPPSNDTSEDSDLGDPLTIRELLWAEVYQLLCAVEDGKVSADVVHTALQETLCRTHRGHWVAEMLDHVLVGVDWTDLLDLLIDEAGADPWGAKEFVDFACDGGLVRALFHWLALPHPDPAGDRWAVEVGDQEVAVFTKKADALGWSAGKAGASVRRVPAPPASPVTISDVRERWGLPNAYACHDGNAGWFVSAGLDTWELDTELNPQGFERYETELAAITDALECGPFDADAAFADAPELGAGVKDG